MKLDYNHMKMKKYIAILVGTIALLFTSVGCTDWLDVLPENQLVKEDFWQTESQVDGIVAGCYRSFTEYDVMTRLVVYGELRSDNLVPFDYVSQSLYKIANVDITPENNFASWTPFYKVINNCNLYLHSAQAVVDLDPNFTQIDFLSYKAEVLTLRALAYFYLVRAFRDVPWITEPSIVDNQNYFVKTSDERAILDSLYKDLAIAEVYAPENSKIASDKTRITKRAVRSLLADIYMWDGEYDNAIAMCDKVIADKSLQLVPAETMYRNVFSNKNSTESIFELYFYSGKNEMENKMVYNYYGGSNNAMAELGFPYFLGNLNSIYCPFTKDVVNPPSKFDITDVTDYRFWESFNYNLLNSFAVGGIFKYAGISASKSTNSGSILYNYSSTSADWIVYRLSDIMLLKAEALVARGDNEQDLIAALKLVNTTYLRANPSVDSLLFSNYNSVNEMGELVLRERQRELLFEGKRWFDLMRLVRRTNSPIEMLKYVGQKFTDDAATQYSKMSIIDGLYFPIATSELKSNKLLEQNSFYADATDSITTPESADVTKSLLKATN